MRAKLSVGIAVGMLLFVMPTTPATAAVATLIPAGSSWRVNDTGSNLGTGWTSANYSDKSWDSMRAQIGFGDGDESSTISSGHDTYYFRTTFSLSSLSGISGLRLNAIIDDGAVAYLNGQEVWRTPNVPVGQDYSTSTTSFVAGTAEDAWTGTDLSAKPLVVGANVLAVEVHQVSRSSTDVSFDLSLATTNTVPAKSLVAPWGLSAIATSSSSIELRWEATSGASGFQVARDGVVVASPSVTAFTDTGLTAATTYKYSVRATMATSVGPWSGTVLVSTQDGPKVMCQITDSRLPEISGMTSSVRFPGVVWVNNDSGDSARVFAVDTSTCTVRAEVKLSGVAPVDFESISMGRSESGAPEIWVGDTGDNMKLRADVRLYRFAEPASLANQAVTVKVVVVTWSDGARDCESLIVEPVASGRVFLVSKEPTGGVYQLQGSFRSTGVAKSGNRLFSTRSSASDAAVAPDRSGTVIRFYNGATLLTGLPGTNARSFTLPSQKQGEAITFSPDGTHLYIASEGLGSDLIRLPVPAF